MRPFTRQPDGEEVIIGVAETGVFLAVPPEAVELLEQFAQGKSVGDVADFYQQKYGEVLDVADFLELLESKGLVAPLLEGYERTEAVRSPAKPAPVRYHFGNFPQPVARCIFSRATAAGCIALMTLALAAMVRDHSLVPRAGDFYFPDHRALSWIILTAVAYAGIFVHELGHLVAALAVGVSSRMGISNRLWFLVAETDLTGLWAVPKRQRYLPFLAGLAIDSVSAALVVLFLFAHNRGWVIFPVLVVRLARALVLSYCLRILWQFFLFVRTDIYFVIVSLFNCRNLLKDTEDFLRNLAAPLVPWVRRVDQSAIPAAERRIIRAYSVLWVAGRLMALYVLFAITFPVAGSYLRSLSAAFGAGYSANPYNFVDSVAMATIFLVPVILGLMLWLGAMVLKERT